MKNTNSKNPFPPERFSSTLNSTPFVEVVIAAVVLFAVLGVVIYSCVKY